MRVRAAYLCGLVIGLLAAGAPRADDAAAEPPAAVRLPGYAFDSPRLLTQQLLWGLVHGVRQLANACRDEPDAVAVATAYADWVDRFRPRIDTAARELARHYFDRDEATLDALTAAIGLRPTLELDPEVRAAACASFAPALEARRYNLDVFYTLRRDAALVARADAVRTRHRRCGAELAPADAQALGDAFAAWEEINGPVESVARARLLAALGDDESNRAWQRDAGAGAVPPTVSCDTLTAALAAPTHQLRYAFGDSE